MTGPSVEPHYRALLEKDRDRFPSEAQFQHWKRHYVSELGRGRLILALLGEHVPGFSPQGRRVLDVGCGDAGVAIAFSRAGAEAAGIEPTSRNLERAAVRVREHDVRVGLIRGVGETLPFSSGTFDLVILDNVLEHVTDRDETLSEIRRVLGPNGILYLVTPKPFTLQSLAGDPHYHVPGLVMLPRAAQKRLVERRLGAGTYQVGWIPTRRWLRHALRRHGFESMVAPRDLWIRYVKDRISRPQAIQPGPKRKLALWLARRDGVFRNPLVRWLLDVGAGSNFFIAKRVA